MARRGTVVAAVLALAACSETLEERFSSMADAKAQGMVARGWIPSGLPADGRDVRVRWNIDTNLVRGMVTVPVAELASLGKGMAVPDEDAVLPFHDQWSLTPSWWPRELNPPRPAGEMVAEGWSLFIVNGRQRQYVAVLRAESKLYFWNDTR